jgi:hypothetical protein
MICANCKWLRVDEIKKNAYPPMKEYEYTEHLNICIRFPPGDTKISAPKTQYCGEFIANA